jgi:nicotinic acetylcholine receptor
MPDWVKRVFLIILPKILFIRQPNYKIKIGNATYSYSTLLNKNKVEEDTPLSCNNNRSPSIYDFRFMRSRMRQEKAMSCSNSRSNTPIREKKYRLPEVLKAIKGINYVFEHMRQEDEEKIVKEQWKYVALVVDR